MAKLRVVSLILFVSMLSAAQVWTRPNQQILVPGLHFRTDATAPLNASLAILFQNPDVCCGKYSALVDSFASANPLHLEEVASRLQGRHVLGDGRPIVVVADYLPITSTDGRPPAHTLILFALHQRHPLLMVWNSQLYVVYGANYDETITHDSDGGAGVMDTVDQLLLFDPATGKQKIFDRLSDDWNRVQGLLVVTVSPSSS